MIPDVIQHLLTNGVFILVARVVLTSFFWLAGIITFLKPAGIIASVEAAGLPAPRAIVRAMIFTELCGSALIIGDVHGLGWLGAGWLGIFTLLSIPLGHPFWKFAPPKKMEEMQIALEHLTVVGGLMCAAALLAVERDADRPIGRSDVAPEVTR